MNSKAFISKALEDFKENELINAGKLYKEKLSEEITETAYYKTLQRMCESGELVKIAKGMYHLPKVSKYGIVPPSEKEIITAFTENETGTVVGYSLYNSLNLTTQVSKTITVMSSALEGVSKTIRNVVVHQTPLTFTDEVTKMVHGLEVLQNFNSIQDINYSAFLKYTEEFASFFNSETFKEVISKKSYKKSTISFMQEILNYYRVKNNLGEYLSSLSKYKHPRMEDLYEAAQFS